MLRSWSVNTRGKNKLALALSSALVLTLFPNAITPIFFRMTTKPMTIRVNREAPPKEAFDELFASPANDDNDWKEIKNQPSTNLNLSASAESGKAWNPIQALNERHVSLPALTFNHEMLRSEMASSSSTSSSAGEEEDNSWIGTLPLKEQKILAAANERSKVLSQDWTLPSWHQITAPKVDAANKVASNNESAHPKILVQGKTTDGHIITPDQLHDGVGVSMMDMKPSQIQVSGKIRLAQGLALGDRSLEIRRFVDGVPLESGQINTQNGTFAIQVPELQGSLAIELFDQSGTIIASANHVLVPEDEKTSLVMDVAAKSQFAGTFVSFNREPNHLIAEKISSTRGEPAEILYASLGVHDKTDALGSFVFSKVSESSFGLIRSRAKGFVDGLMILPAGEPKGISLIPEHLVEALKEIIQGGRAQSVDSAGMIWGQVLFDGKPMSGVSVVLDENTDILPVYLNGFIPQDGLEGTTENGYFVFLGLTPGMHTAVATRNGEYVGHVNLQVDEGSVSIGNLEATIKNQVVPVKVYDAFDGSPQAASVHIQSLKDSVHIFGQSQIYLPQIQRLSFGYVQPDQAEYMPYQFAYSDKEDFLHAPLVKSEWLEKLFVERRVSSVPDTGIIVGFVPEDEFEAYLSHEDAYDSSNIVYFDQQGRVSQQGVAGGGFVMFNVPASTQSIVVLSKKTEMLSSTVIPVDVNSTSVLKFRF